MLMRVLLGMSVGAGLGGMLGSTRSCESGGCPLTASPWRGAFFGGVLGLAAVLGTVAPGYSAAEGEAMSGEVNSAVESVSQNNFRETIDDGVVLVDFWAPWCGPCREQLPILEGVAVKVEGRADVVKVNVDDNAALAKALGVRSIPTMILFADGKPTKRFVGVQQEKTLLTAIATELSPDAAPDDKE